MKVALALVLAVGCSSSPKAQGTTSTSSSAMPAAEPAAATRPPAPVLPAARGSQYSCFSYVSKNSTQQRHACMRSDDCGPYLEQARSLGGIRELSGCATVPSVYCFHQAATQDEPDGLEVCQPTLDECKAARADVVRAKMPVDSDCAQP